MSFTEMSLPLDVPWKRMGVSSQMIDLVSGDLEFPQQWNSSVAVFYHEPTELPPEYCNRKVTYLKIVCTLSNFQYEWNELGILDDLKEFPSSWFRMAWFEKSSLARSYPCYGALLQVGVYPNPSNGVAVHDYPYISGFEPRKREMYETVSESGEILSQSANKLSVGKQLTDTRSNEDYDLDTGSNSSWGWSAGQGQSSSGSGSVIFGVAQGSSEQSSQWSLSGQGSEGSTGQWGTIARNNRQEHEVINTDASREKRESTSYSTTMNHIYSLLQGYHLGTNRALFFLQPRPHIQDLKFTFLQGPRRLEGIQEFFLIVNRPASVPGLCVDVTLETAHLHTQYSYRPRLIPLSELYAGRNLEKTAEALGLDSSHPIYSSYVDAADAWNKYRPSIRLLIHKMIREGVWPDLSNVSVYDISRMQWVVGKLPDIGLEDVAVIFEEYESDDGDLFLVGRHLRSCVTPTPPGEQTGANVEASTPGNISSTDPKPYVVYAKRDVSINDWKHRCSGDMRSGRPQNMLHNAIATEMRKSIHAPQRFARGQLRFHQTEFVLDDLANLLSHLREAGVEDKHLDALENLPPGVAERLRARRGIETVMGLADLSTDAVAEEMNLGPAEAMKLRGELLRGAIASLGSTRPSTRPSTRNPIQDRFDRRYPKERLAKLMRSGRVGPVEHAMSDHIDVEQASVTDGRSEEDE